jgi:hypothetical protein
LEWAARHEKLRYSKLMEMTMNNRDSSSTLIPMKILCGAAGVAAAVLIMGAAVTFSPRSAQALPAYAAQTGLPCGRCHINPAGGGANTAFGKAFGANGHKLLDKKK